MSDYSFGENNFIGALEAVSRGFQDFVDNTNKTTKKLIALEAENKALREALKFIEEWSLPPVKDRDGKEHTYRYLYGSNGERDYMRGVAMAALQEQGE